MKLNSTVLFVSDISVSKKFYCDILKLQIEHDFGKNIIYSNGLAIWEIHPEHKISKQLNTREQTNRFELYFESENLEILVKNFDSQNVKFLHEIHEEPWGQRTIRFFDPDNHLIEIGEPLHVFVINLKNNGLSPQQISRKTGINLKTVDKILSNS